MELLILGKKKERTSFTNIQAHPPPSTFASTVPKQKPHDQKLTRNNIDLPCISEAHEVGGKIPVRFQWTIAVFSSHSFRLPHACKDMLNVGELFNKRESLLSLLCVLSVTSYPDQILGQFV